MTAQQPQPSVTPARPDSAAGPGTPTRRPVLTRWLLVVVLILHAVLAISQPFSAGLYLSGEFDAVAVHGAAGSALVAYTMMVQLPVSFLFWIPGRGPFWPFVVTIGLFFAESMQVGMGYTRSLAVHIPLGVALVGVTVAMAVWVLVWRPGRRSS